MTFLTHSFDLNSVRSLKWRIGGIKSELHSVVLRGRFYMIITVQYLMFSISHHDAEHHYP